MAKIELIAVDLLDDHPQNPRIAWRDDVIDTIVANLGDEWPKKHALSVRPVDGRYQILSGHTRKRAAAKKGIENVWCWVDDVDDAAAYMELATSNAQGELSPLEIGMHCLRCETLATAGRGKKGGLAEYARRVGKAKSYVTEIRNAAIVFDAIKSFGQPNDLLTKAMHLCAIHAAPRSVWGALVECMLKEGWSKDRTADVVAKVLEFSEPPEQWNTWLPLTFVVERYLKTLEFSPQTVDKLIALANSTVTLITEHKRGNDDMLTKYIAWVHAEKPLDPRLLIKKHAEIHAELESDKTVGWYHGDWHDFLGEIADESVAVAFTDPPYGIGYQSDRRRDRSRPRKHKTIEGDSSTAALTEALVALHSKLRSDGSVFCFCHWSNEPEVREAITSAGYKIRNSIIWVKNAVGMGDPTTTFAPKHERIIYAVKGSPTLYKRLADVFNADRCDSSRHPTEKPQGLIEAMLSACAVAGELVADPFGGVATTAAACIARGLRFWSCEIDADYHRVGEDRLNRLLDAVRENNGHTADP